MQQLLVYPPFPQTGRVQVPSVGTRPAASIHSHSHHPHRGGAHSAEDGRPWHSLQVGSSQRRRNYAGGQEAPGTWTVWVSNSQQCIIKYHLRTPLPLSSLLPLFSLLPFLPTLTLLHLNSNCTDIMCNYKQHAFLPRRICIQNSPIVHHSQQRGTGGKASTQPKVYMAL